MFRPFFIILFLTTLAQAQWFTSITATSGTSSTTATVAWRSCARATAQVYYGLTLPYSRSTALNSTLANAHTASLSGLTAGKTYHYKVVGTDSAGLTISSKDHTFIAGAHVVNLTWNLSTTPNVSYSAYRSTISGSSYGLIRSGLAVNRLTDTTVVSRTTYYYVVTAVDLVSGRESVYSNQAIAIVP